MKLVNKQNWIQCSYKNDLPWTTGHLPKYSINKLMSKVALIRINFSLLFTVNRSLKAIKRKSENLSRSWTSSWSENKSKIKKAICYYRHSINVLSRRATGFHRWVKHFELKLFIWKTFPWRSNKVSYCTCILSSQPVNLPVPVN